MTEVQSSRIAVEEIGLAIKERKDLIAETEHALLLKVPGSGFSEKALLVAADGNQCSDIVDYLRKKDIQVRIWHELLKEHGAVIIDKLSARQIEILQDYSPSEKK